MRRDVDAAIAGDGEGSSRQRCRGLPSPSPTFASYLAGVSDLVAAFLLRGHREGREKQSPRFFLAIALEGTDLYRTAMYYTLVHCAADL